MTLTTIIKKVRITATDTLATIAVSVSDDWATGVDKTKFEMH